MTSPSSQPSAEIVLKPCPFCGGKAEVMGDAKLGYYVTCAYSFACFGELGSLWSDEKRATHCFSYDIEAALAWNKRAPIEQATT